jgi:hypothetical protein
MHGVNPSPSRMAGLDPAIQSFSAPSPGWPARGPAMRGWKDEHQGR